MRESRQAANILISRRRSVGVRTEIKYSLDNSRRITLIAVQLIVGRPTPSRLFIDFHSSILYLCIFINFGMPIITFVVVRSCFVLSQAFLVISD